MGYVAGVWSVLCVFVMIYVNVIVVWWMVVVEYGCTVLMDRIVLFGYIYLLCFCCGYGWWYWLVLYTLDMINIPIYYILIFYLY